MDRTVKALLTLIAVALWGLLLRPLVTPTIAQAAAPAAGFPAITAANDTSTFVVVQNGRAYSLTMYPHIRVTGTVPLR